MIINVILNRNVTLQLDLDKVDKDSYGFKSNEEIIEHFENEVMETEDLLDMMGAKLINHDYTVKCEEVK